MHTSSGSPIVVGRGHFLGEEGNFSLGVTCKFDW